MSQDIESLLHENRVFEPSLNFRQGSHLSSFDEYKRLYSESISNPTAFWNKAAQLHLDWFSPWNTTLKTDWISIGTKAGSYTEWFSGGTLNASFNCLDRHVIAGKGEKVALQWQGENKNEARCLTYQELLSAVENFSSALKNIGIGKGDCITIYMPMLPELVVAVLACARIGAIHSVVFSAFSADALKNRIQDCNSKLVITSDISIHAGKQHALKANVDQALAECPTVAYSIVYKRGAGACSMQAGRDLWWHEAIANAEGTFAAVACNSEDPLFVLYTSGSTGKPKGVLHTTAGYLLYTTMTAKYVFDLQDNDVFWCTADVGWITGHSYLIYGPLSNGATCVMFEGTPTYPEADRFWEIIEKYQVTIFYTAPTAIRSLMRLGEELPNKHNLTSLRLLGTVGEPINPEAWMWYYNVIGQERCPVVDTWWQTETGGIMITTLPGAMQMKPGSAGLPFFGVKPNVLLDNGIPAKTNEGGKLVIESAWPGVLRGVYGDKKNELIKKVYFSDFPGKYFSGDGCRIDEDGYYWLLGRIDDVLNVSGHRLATAEIESALVAHIAVSEAAVVGYSHEIKGQGIYCFVTIKEHIEYTEVLKKEIISHVRSEISPIATPDVLHFTPTLPKTRSGKIMRRILRKIAEGEIDNLGDTSTLADASVIQALLETRPFN